MCHGIEIVKFPDKVFERFLVENFDYDNDGRISTEDASQIVSLEIAGKLAPHITSLQGIEQFPNLRELTVKHTNIYTLDVSRNKSLEHLDCMDNRLLWLNLGRLGRLKRLYCDGNRLERLDVSGLPSLKLLWCRRNRLTELELASNLQLKVLWCGNNLLTELDVSGLPQLSFIRCENNLLTELDLSENRALLDIQINGNFVQLSLPPYENCEIEELICNAGHLEMIKQHYVHLWHKIELAEIETPESRQRKLFSGNYAEIKIDFIPAMLTHDIEHT